MFKLISFQFFYTERIVDCHVGHAKEAQCFWLMVSPMHSRFHDRRISQTGRFGKKLSGNRFPIWSICTRRLQLLTHIVRRKEDQDHCRVLNASLAPPKSWSRRTGKPIRTCLHTVEDEPRPLNFALHTVRRRALDRGAWSQIFYFFKLSE